MMLILVGTLWRKTIPLFFFLFLLMRNEEKQYLLDPISLENENFKLDWLQSVIGIWFNFGRNITKKKDSLDCWSLENIELMEDWVAKEPMLLTEEDLN